MVGRLVEQHDVRLRRQHAGKGGAPGLAAGQLVRVFLAGQAEILHQIGGAIGIVGGSEPCLDIGADSRETLHVGNLRQIAHGRRRLAEHLAVLRFDQAGGNLQQRRLAGAIAADQCDVVAGGDRKAAPSSSGVPPKVSFIPSRVRSGGAMSAFRKG